MFDTGGSHKKSWLPYGQHSVSGPIHVRGRGGYGSYQQQQWVGGGGDTSYGHTYQQQEFGGESYDRGYGHGGGSYDYRGGRGEFGRYHPYGGGGRGGASTGWGVGRGAGIGREGYEKGRRGVVGGGWGNVDEMSGGSEDGGFGYGGAEFGDSFGGRDVPQHRAKIGGEMNSQLQASPLHQFSQGVVLDIVPLSLAP